MPDVEALTVDEVVELNGVVRDLAGAALSMTEAAQAIVTSLHERWSGSVVLARLYVTVRHRNLPRALQEIANQAHGAPLDPTVPCLTLVGTAGAEPAWCDPARSQGHRAIPLGAAQVVRERIPMVGGLLDQLDVDIDSVVDLTAERALVLHHREYGVFHVPDARGSSLIPAQDFVDRYDVRSVVGCGGGLPSGEVFALVAFARQAIDEKTTGLFRTLAYGIKAALVPFTYRVFD